MNNTNTRILSYEKIMRVKKSKQYIELTTEELDELYKITAIEHQKTMENIAGFFTGITIAGILGVITYLIVRVII